MTKNPSHIPAEAIRVFYQAEKACGYFYIWRRGSMYIWEALGRQGYSEEYETAAHEARTWIGKRQLKTKESN